MAKAKKETPLMRQYNAIKAKYPNALLLFRVGDFYETFGSDAIQCSQILDIVLTKRANGSAAHIELAGFPHHALNTYLPKLVRAGLRVAICDQLEEASKDKKIVKRGVTELVTPGLAMNDNILNSKSNNFLMALSQEKDIFGVALIDVSTGEFYVMQANLKQLHKIVQSFRPKELIFDKRKGKPKLTIHNSFGLDDWAFQPEYAKNKIMEHYKTKSIKGFGIQHLPVALLAIGGIFAYLEDTHHRNLTHLQSIQRIEHQDSVWMDDFTVRNLEIFDSPNQNAITLLQILDKTCTAMGARTLQKWLRLVLKNQKKIEKRLAFVQAFLSLDWVREDVREKLNQLPDLERFAAKIATHKITPKQLNSLSFGLKINLEIQELLLNSKNSQLLELGKSLHSLQDLQAIIENTLSADPPHQISKGNTINTGVSKVLDQLRNLQQSGHSFLEEMKTREQTNTGIPKLKISFNNIFGYYLEVRNTHKDKVPKHWIRKQTLVNAERYITEELKEYENQILGAEEKILNLELNLYQDLINKVNQFLQPIQDNAKLLGKIDVLSNFAHLAKQNHYTKPKITNDFDLMIEDGRHPVIEKQLPSGEFYISNSIVLNQETQQIVMITGPNMSGKSALLRQTALIVIMAQIGCYVPAKSSKIGLVDQIFTRVGASDNISSGESTFMVEMNETASILNNLSKRSLILLDEIGRGTSTYDGISIAWSIAEFIHNHTTKAKTLFATHYHELNDMSQSYPRIKNYSVSIKELQDKILFLRKLVPGGSEHSFGIQVAKMAGMPKKVIARSEEILRKLEQSESKKQLHKKTEQIGQENLQLSFFQLDDPILESIREELLHTEINTLTPIEALMKLNEIRKKLGQ